MLMENPQKGTNEDLKKISQAPEIHPHFLIKLKLPPSPGTQVITGSLHFMTQLVFGELEKVARHLCTEFKNNS
jgi:hypothetical protein